MSLGDLVTVVVPPPPPALPQTVFGARSFPSFWIVPEYEKATGAHPAHVLPGLGLLLYNENLV